MGGHVKAELAAEVRQVLLSPFGLAPVTAVPGRQTFRLAVEAAERHGVLGALYRSPLYERFEPEAAEEIRAAYFQDLTRHLRTSELLRVLSESMSAQGVRWALVKGPALAERVYPTADLRGYRDLDLLVHPDDFGPALALIEEAGGSVLERNWSLNRVQRRGEIGLKIARGCFVDLHWHLLNDPVTRRHFRLDTGELLARARPAALPGLSVQVLDPADEYVHLALHACLSGGHRLRWLVDLVFAARAGRVEAADFDARVLAAAERARAGVALAVTARRATRWIQGAELPTPAARPAWAIGAAGYDVLRRQERWFGGPGSGRLMASVARPRVSASLRAGFAEVADAMLHQLGRRPAEDAEPELFRPDPDPTARDRYLAQVRGSAP